jgi:hypothetical protein
MNVGIAFEILDLPLTFTRIKRVSRHLMFDVKMNFDRRADGFLMVILLGILQPF